MILRLKLTVVDYFEDDDLTLLSRFLCLSQARAAFDNKYQVSRKLELLLTTSTRSKISQKFMDEIVLQSVSHPILIFMTAYIEFVTLYIVFIALFIVLKTLLQCI